MWALPRLGFEVAQRVYSYQVLNIQTLRINRFGRIVRTGGSGLKMCVRLNCEDWWCLAAMDAYPSLQLVGAYW